MANKLLKGIVTCVLFVIMGVLLIIEKVVEIVFQLSKLLKSGYSGIMRSFIGSVDKLYSDEKRWNVFKKRVRKSN